MFMKLKQKWLSIFIVLLGMTIFPVHASGVPVVDVVAIAKALQNIKNMIRGKLSEIAGFEVKADMLTPQQIQDILAKKLEDCERISNLKSKALCKEMIQLEKVKMELAKQGNKEIDEKWRKYQEAVRNYNTKQANEAKGAMVGDTNTGKLQTEEGYIASLIENMNSTFHNIEFQMKIIDGRIEILRKARLQIAHEQMKGTSLTSSMTKGAIVEHIRKKTELIQYNEKNENNIQTLREKNNKKSNDAWNSYQKFPK